MIDEREYNYNVQREIAERSAARRATQPLVRAIHEDLADRYASVVRAGKGGIDERTR